jgi:hypothetical protein
MIPTHPLVQGYLHRHQVPASQLRADGRLTLSLGERARMQLQPLPGGALLFEGRVAPLPPAGRARTERIDRMLRASAARMAQHPQALAIDAAAEAWVLQLRVDEDLSPVAFDEAVDDFFRALVFWKAMEAAA